MGSGLGFRAYGMGVRVESLGFRGWGLGLRVAEYPVPIRILKCLCKGLDAGQR